MIKAVTKSIVEHSDVRTMEAEVTVNGSYNEIMHEFLGILNSLENECPDLLLMALRKHTEEKINDN